MKTLNAVHEDNINQKKLSLKVKIILNFLTW